MPAALAFTLCATACTPPAVVAPPAAAPDLICPATVPLELTPAADQDLAFVLTVWNGVQRYTCTAAGWTFVTPDADLFERATLGLVVHHFSGPTWLHDDTSFVVASKTAGVTVDATAIQWLLLTATDHGGAKDGVLAGITSIQRMETHGGLAPDAGALRRRAHRARPGRDLRGQVRVLSHCHQPDAPLRRDRRDGAVAGPAEREHGEGRRRPRDDREAVTPAERHDGAVRAREQARGAVDAAVAARNGADAAYIAALRAESQAVDELLAASAAVRDATPADATGAHP
jgi:hypothetical protein